MNFKKENNPLYLLNLIEENIKSIDNKLKHLFPEGYEKNLGIERNIFDKDKILESRLNIWKNIITKYEKIKILHNNNIVYNKKIILKILDIYEKYGENAVFQLIKKNKVSIYDQAKIWHSLCFELRKKSEKNLSGLAMRAYLLFPDPWYLKTWALCSAEEQNYSLADALFSFLPKEVNLSDKDIETAINAKNNIIKNINADTLKENYLHIIESISAIKDNIKKIKLIHEKGQRFNENENDVLIKYKTARIDIKNLGTNNNKIDILNISDSSAKIDMPKWFCDDKGQGVIIESLAKSLNLKIKCIGDGDLSIALRGIDFKAFDKKRYPVYLKYNTFKINDKEFIDKHVVASHDSPFSINLKNIKDQENIDIYTEWMIL